MTPHSVLLDLDGTLVASRDGIVRCLRQALRDLGHVPDPERDLTWVVGPPLHDIVARLLLEFGDDRHALAIERYRHHYEGGGLFESPLFPGIREALERLAGTGHRLFLCTSNRCTRRGGSSRRAASRRCSAACTALGRTMAAPRSRSWWPGCWPSRRSIPAVR